MFFVLLFAAFVVPMGGTALLVVFGPHPYVLNGEGPGLEWLKEKSFQDGSLVLVRRYETESEAARAARDVADAVSDRLTRNPHNVARYYRSDRDRHGLVLPVGEYVVHVGAPSAEGVEKRFRALGFVRENPDRNPLSTALDDHFPLTLAGFGGYIAFLGLFMVRGGAWAARVAPDKAAVPVPLSTLRSRLMEINRLNLPFQVTEVRPGRFVADWRIVDAKWIGVMQAGGLRSAHRVFVDLDETQHKARVLDRAGMIRWEADGVGRFVGGLSFFQGIVFAQFERGRMVGLLYDRKTGWSIREGYNYRFDLAEMKRPLIEAVTRSGWTWQPVVTFFRPIGG